MKCSGLWILVLVALSSNYLLAQVQVSSSEVDLQKRFIEAYQAKSKGEIDKAIDLFEDLRRANDEIGAVYYELALLFEAKDNTAQAIKMGLEAIELEPENQWYYRALGNIYEKVGRYDAAADLYRKLIKKDPNNVEFYMTQAVYLIKQQDIKGAIKVYNELESRRGINEELSRRKYSLYLGLGDFKSAEGEIQALVDSDPNNISYLILLAEYYERLDKESVAQNLYKKILELDPDNGKAQAALVSDMEGAGSNATEYARSLRPLIARENLAIDLKIGKLLPLLQQAIETNEQSLFETLLELVGVLKDIHPNEAKGYSIAGDLYFYNNQLSEAVEQYEKTLTLDDTVFSVWEQLMYAHLRMKSYEELKNVAEEAMDLFPNRVKSYELYGIAATYLGDPQEAISLLQEALFMAGQNPGLKAQLFNALAIAYGKTGNETKAKESFEQGMQENGESLKLLRDYSRFLARSKEVDQAFILAQRMEKLLPNAFQVAATRGYIYYHNDEFRKAKKEYENALIEGGEKDAEILEELGNVYFKLEDIDNALLFWKKALELDGGSDLLKKKIEERSLFE